MAAALPHDTLGNALSESWPAIWTNLPAQIPSTDNFVPSVHMATVSAARSSTDTYGTPSSAKRTWSGLQLKPNTARTHLHSTTLNDPLTPLPGRYAMHLADNLLLLNVKSIPDLSDQLSELVDDALALGQAMAQPGQPSPRDIHIPHQHDTLSKVCRERSALNCGKTPVATIEDVRDAFSIRHELAAAISSVLVESSSAFPNSGEGNLRYSTTPITLKGNDVEDLPRAGAYFSVHPRSPDLDRRLKDFGLSDIVVFDFQAAAGPLRLASLFHVMQQMVKHNIPWEWQTCKPKISSVEICGSRRCNGFPGLNVASISGRPTSVDGDRILDIIERSLANHVDVSGEAPPVFPPYVIALVVFLWQDLWSKAVAVDASCMVLCSGHEEVIFLRERRTQTMYMSKTLSIGLPMTGEVPSHVKIYCGVALLAWQDVVDRQAKMANLRRIGRLPRSWRFNFDGDIDLSNPSIPFAIKNNAYRLSMGEFLPNALTDPELQMDCNFLRRTFSMTSTIELCLDPHSFGVKSAIFSRSPPLSQQGGTRRVRIHMAPLHSDRLSIAYLEYGEHSGEGLVGLPYGRSFMLRFSHSAETLREEQHILERVRALRLQGCKVSVPFTIDGIFTCTGRRPSSGFYTSFFIMEHCQRTPIGIADSIPSSIADELHTWLSAVHRAGFTHNRLSDQCILWRPGGRSIFVTGWSQGKRRGEDNFAFAEEVSADTKTLAEMLSTPEGNPQKRRKY